MSEYLNIEKFKILRKPDLASVTVAVVIVIRLRGVGCTLLVAIGLDQVIRLVLSRLNTSNILDPFGDSFRVFANCEK